MSPKRNSKEYSDMPSGDFFEIKVPRKGRTDHFKHMCCDCLLVHHWHIENLGKGKIRLYLYRDDHATTKARKKG